ncbi:hypothetical protein [Streptomyces luteogriseus]|uniref:hypothetical protein n=1 Tax=Streptomyces luteogriseus TaxID=68233 RepID=UPI0037A76321
MIKRRDDYEDPYNPDELDEEELEAMKSSLYAGASDLEICREADLGDPVANAIFYGWPKERREAAAREVDKAES